MKQLLIEALAEELHRLNPQMSGWETIAARLADRIIEDGFVRVAPPGRRWTERVDVGSGVL